MMNPFENVIVKILAARVVAERLGEKLTLASTAATSRDTGGVQNRYSDVCDLHRELGRLLTEIGSIKLS